MYIKYMYCYMYIYVLTCDNPVLFKLGGSNPTSQNQLYLYKHYSQRLVIKGL